MVSNFASDMLPVIQTIFWAIAGVLALAVLGGLTLIVVIRVVGFVRQVFKQGRDVTDREER